MNSDFVIRINKNKFSTSQIAFHILFLIFWMRYTGVQYVIHVLKMLPIIQYFGDYILPAVVLLFMLLAIPYMIRQIRKVDILFYISCTLVVLLSMLVWPKNAEYIEADLVKMLTQVFPIYFLGICYCQEDMKKTMFVASLLGIVIMFSYQMYSLSSGAELNADNMYVAYNCLPSVMYAVYWALEKKKLGYWLLAIPGMVLLLMLGTRGSILATLLFVLIRIFGNVFSIKNAIMKVIASGACILVAYFLIATDVIEVVAEGLAEVFEEIGVSTRVLDLFLEGEIMSASGRDTIAQTVLGGINEKMLLGWGIMGDRVLVGNYAHNLALELWCQFGVIFGSIFLVWIISLPLMGIWGNPNKGRKHFILMLAVMVLTKLMLSNSYLLEPYLFLMLGLSVAETRRRKKNQICYAEKDRQKQLSAICVEKKETI